MRLRLIVLCAVLCTASAPARARADAPAPRWVCGVTGKPCSSCSHASAAAYDACAAAAADAGLVPACEDVRIYGDKFSTQYFCPKEAKVEMVPEAPPSVGCSRCSAAGETSLGSAALTAVAAICAIAARRLRGRRRWCPYRTRSSSLRTASGTAPRKP